jgi:phosphoribosylglycinamide formyltransferase-1
MKKIVVMASGEGSNFSAIVESGIKVNRVITDNPNANVIKRAKEAGIGSCLIVPDKKETREEYDKQIDYYIGGRSPIPNLYSVDLIVLAGWMRIFSPWFCYRWAGKIINIHPSLLPAFAGGCNAIEDAYNHGCKVTGVTIHWVTPEVDAGPIIAQGVNHIFTGQPLGKVKEDMHKLEHYLYPKTIKELINS